MAEQRPGLAWPTGKSALFRGKPVVRRKVSAGNSMVPLVVSRETGGSFLSQKEGEYDMTCRHLW